MTSSPSDPWGVPAPSPNDPWRAAEPPTPGPWVVPSPAPAPQSASPGPQAPPSPASAPPLPGPAATHPGPVIVQIAEIAVTSTTVHTPAGDIPLAGSQWQVNDYWFTQQRTPRWAIIAAIVGFCVLTVFSLLFLLIKESVTQGTVQVTVTNATRQYVARIPVHDQHAVTAINQQVNYVRTLAAL
jgi:hypothetical protein